LGAITITLNGREVSGHSGMTIMDLAEESGIDIPRLCHDPCLTPIGACRICLVEDERSGRLSASCVTPIDEGMVINTESPKVLDRRKTIVKLMLASHPDACLVCDKGNSCELRSIATDMGIGLVDLIKIPQTAVIEEINPFIERDLSKCILCAKCIRADHELVVQGAIDYIGRGFSSKPATLNDTPLDNSECTFCGTCVAICPTGALMEKKRTYRGTVATNVSTTCPFCGCGCTINMDVRDNQIIRARPGDKSVVNCGTLCVKGSYGYDFVHSTERLTKPLVKVNGEFEETTWENALELVASELKKVKDTSGPDSLAVLSSSKCTNEENYLLQKLARVILNTNNIDNGSRLYSAAGNVGLGSTVGFPGTTNRLGALEQSEVIMIVGANITSSAPTVGYAVKRAVRYGGAGLIIVDPQQTELLPFARLWLKPKIGTDTALLNGMARLIITQNLMDDEFVSRKTDNFEALSKDLDKYTPEYVEEITGVPVEDLKQAAGLYAEAAVASIVYGSGITQRVSGTDSVTALANLAMLTGNIGVSGGIFAMRRDCNGQGACDMGAMPNLLPGYQSVENEQLRKRCGDRWGAELPGVAGLTAIETIGQAGKGNIKAMYIVGENPALSFPNTTLVEQALASLDFLVVQDMFLTETAQLAQVVLPASSFAEKEGTFTNFEGRVQRVNRVIEPLGDSLPDWEIILRLADAMGNPMPYSSLNQIMDEIEELVPVSIYQAADRRNSGIRDMYSSEISRDSLRNRRLFKGDFPSGFGRFSPVHYEPASDMAKNGYPLTLLTGSVIHHLGSGSRSSRSSRLSEFSTEGFVGIGDSDAARIGINAGDKIKVISPVGEITATVRLDNKLQEGTVFMPVSFPSTPVNKLFGINLDPRAKTPALKSCAVKLERI